MAKNLQTVKMFPVKSENVEKIGYRDSDQTLVIKFKKSDDLYYFHGVPKARFSYMRTTKTSVGHYFHTQIKDKYDFIKNG